MNNNTIKSIIFLILTFCIFCTFFLFSNNTTKANAFLISSVQSAYPNQNITVTIAASRSTEYNAVQLNITFNNLTYLNATVASGWTPVQGPTATGNTVTFAGALLGSSATGNRNVLSITLRTQNVGTATINVSGVIDGTGLGTGSNNVSNSRNIQVVPRPTPTATPSPSPSPTQIPTLTPSPTNIPLIGESLPKEVIINSQSHPDQEKWYNTNIVKLNWNKENDVVEFSYLLDKNPETVPDTISEGSNTSIEIKIPEEGINYFHIRAKNSNGWGPVSRYKIKVDLTPPDAFIPEIKINLNSGINFLLFNTKDNLSEKIKYKIYVNDNFIGETLNNQIQIPKDTILKKVRIEAFDEAGNMYSYDYNLEVISQHENGDQPKVQINNNLYENIQNKDDKPDPITIISILLNIIFSIYSIIISYLYFTNKRKHLNQNPE